LLLTLGFCPSSPKLKAICQAEADSAPCAAPSVRRGGGNEPQGCGESQRWHRDVPSLTVTEASRLARDQAAVGITLGQGLPRGQIGVWTGLIIPAPIWREGRDSPSGLRSHGWRSEAFSPLARRRPPQVDRSPASARRNRISVWPLYRPIGNLPLLTRNGHHSSRTLTLGQAEAKADQPKDRLFRRLMLCKET